MNTINDTQASPPRGESVQPVSQSNQTNTSANAVAHAIKIGNVLPSNASQGGKQAPRASHAEVNKAVVQINDYLQQQNRSLEFTVDKSTGQTVIKIVDQANGKVLRQIPPEYMLQLAQTLLEHNGVNSTGVKVKT